MGMSSEDFGAVLGELDVPTPLSDIFEARYPQKDDSRWWFTTRMHCAGFFVSKPVQVDACDKRNKHLLIASKTWRGMKRPEMYLWILEALGLQEKAKALSDLLHAKLDKGECDLNTLVEIAKGVFNWEEVEKAARKEFDRLVSKSPMPHRPI